MYFKSTRSQNGNFTASYAIAEGLASDKGLFVPSEFPLVTLDFIKSLADLPYNERASKILSLYLNDFSESEINECTKAAYSTNGFFDDIYAPVESFSRSNGDKMHVLELWHGRTSAFKDMALQLLPHLLVKSLEKQKNSETIAHILVATSGDTGTAAIAGFSDVKNTKITVYYPENGVSPIQKAQMLTSTGKNVDVIGIKGNFDDCQRGVKQIFSSDDIKAKLKSKNVLLSSANSINFGRLAPQIVYYFSAFADLAKKGVNIDNGVNFVVPTGNFGNILAGYYAKKMGLPVNKLICASNINNVLTDFINTGVYDSNRQFYKSISPSMDILVSSNLERLIYDLYDCDSDAIFDLMEKLNNDGKYKVSDACLSKVKEHFYGGFATDDETISTIKEVYENSDNHYLLDTHTAVAVNVYDKYKKETSDSTPTIIVSTASAFKFSSDVLKGVDLSAFNSTEGDFAKFNKLSEVTGAKIPSNLADLEGKKFLFNKVIEPTQMAENLLASYDL